MRRSYKHPGNREEITALEDAIRFWQRSYTAPGVEIRRMTLFSKSLSADAMLRLTQ